MVKKGRPADEAELSPLFGVGREGHVEGKELERHIAAAADSIGATLKDAEANTGAVPLYAGWATHLYGMWVKDGGESRYVINQQTYDQVKGVISAYERRGFAPIDFMGADRLFEPWTLLMSTGPLGAPVSTTDEDEFCRQDIALFKAGYRIVSFNRRHDRFNATYRSGPENGAQWIRWDMDYFELLAWDAHYRAQGLRVVAIDRYGSMGLLYAAVWQPGKGEQIIEAPGGFNTFLGQPQWLNVYRYRQRGLHVRAIGHNGYPVVVFRPTESNGEPVWYAAPPAQFAQRDQQLRNQGYRLDTVSHASWQFG